MNCNPRWGNETFVLRMEASFYQALNLVLYTQDPEMRQRVLDKYKRKVRTFRDMFISPVIHVSVCM